ncbi:class I SAM-dependent methyltransferase [Methylococcus sp. ANG]|uniref:class I SAM-dependent methyltransferase n=1 Tax=unclassified Methylococcus TaxID=2618889 RepID=UPI001C52742C|nr:class I SAM-dependent methyltransferase [Methylococcus sp. Mc7]QXP82650.1 class I SAM-dependent methyltransferase [Methylococcus sp. Mc7]
MTLKVFHVDLDYPLSAHPRYELGKKPHPGLLAVLERQRKHYEDVIHSFSKFAEPLSKLNRLPQSVQLSPHDLTQLSLRYSQAIQGSHEANEWFMPIAGEVAREISPCWLNGWIPGLDGMALYAFMALQKPQTYIEIGSGASTKFVHQAASDYGLSTRIISIDPHPRSEIDKLCDTIIRTSLEETDLVIFDNLNAGDMLFFDGTHRCFANSDVTVFFLEVLPRLKPGVLVGIHDIFLPYDYPTEWVRKGYSEQYLLAALLLANTSMFTIEFPALFISYDKRLSQRMESLWEQIPNVFEKHGGAFWIRTRKP